MVKPFVLSRIPEIHFGAGKFADLLGIIAKKGRNVLIVTGWMSFRKSVQWSDLTKALNEKGVKFWDVQVKDEPSPDLVDDVCLQFREKKIDLVIGIGGGSALDGAKAISAMLPLNDSVMGYLEGVGAKQHPGCKVTCIAVPTTSGTGSEATKNAVLSKVGETGFKKSLRHDNFTPDIALVDPLLTVTCPPELTVACGMDAFSQLLEAYVSDNASPFTDSLAFEALRCMKNSLLTAYHKPDNLEARSRMAYASLISGICLANAGLGIIHGFASSVGGYFDIPHGVVCGTLMGASTRINIEKLIQTNPEHIALKKYAKVGRLFISHRDRDHICYARNLAQTIEKWTSDLNIPRLGEFGVKEKDFDRIISSTGNKNNPVKLGREEMRQILIERV
jgi:alcohol dehydrogenase class IV